MPGMQYTVTNGEGRVTEIGVVLDPGARPADESAFHHRDEDGDRLIERLRVIRDAAVADAAEAAGR